MKILQKFDDEPDRLIVILKAGNCKYTNFNLNPTCFKNYIIFSYWQELIDIILYMHLKTPILYNLWNGDIYTPVALSIVQARFVGLVHFSTGFILTYAAFIIGATS